ncbi:hypothetical protein HKX54_02335 [Sulfitobacter sp. M57]|uniref:hypothetical protein n=1 Tax=unclassified Sulfitobacter TaxID=196795 RepID=UPI0023E26BF5|nr:MULTISPECIES: hypothetical protein [unclassified Sulfitobacter]MDF3413281.1 hypothetical protein [Sulfitobacter sp. KE5]MDF3421439.1 hypothetical protein [Sulfitobacter sp. KE43]MDF3431828.1 hypothetical protein [Sulfitobacter sp. KE42]MDF3457468.1 hypothetical protein [Sulfitobacter sp. S74]MDF3461370.1 hypothetical protein [Sulfitobacter sp. Ks18]
MNPNLLNNLAPLVLGNAIAAASNTDDDTAIIDMAGFEGVVFMASIDDSAATAVAEIKVQQSAANAGGGMVDLVGAVATLTSAVDDDLNAQFLAVDVFRPTERYLRVNRASNTANIAFGSVIAIRYGARKVPIDVAGAGVATVVRSPAEV